MSKSIVSEAEDMQQSIESFLILVANRVICTPIRTLPRVIVDTRI
jgi:hypothetical protein